MPSKKFGTISVGGYSKFRNMFYLSLPLSTSVAGSSAKKHDGKDECTGDYCSYSALKILLLLFDISKHSGLFRNPKTFLP